jgi:choline-glycine betaine transporter
MAVPLVENEGIPEMYSPITTLMAIPLAYNHYQFVQSIKSQSAIDPTEAFRRLFSVIYLGNVDTRSITITVVVMYCTLFMGWLTLSAFAECIVQLYHSPRFRTYLAIGIAGYAMSLAYNSIAFPIHSLIAYRFVTAL